MTHRNRFTTLCILLLAAAVMTGCAGRHTEPDETGASPSTARGDAPEADCTEDPAADDQTAEPIGRSETDAEPEPGAPDETQPEAPDETQSDTPAETRPEIKTGPADEPEATDGSETAAPTLPDETSPAQEIGDESDTEDGRIILPKDVF